MTNCKVRLGRVGILSFLRLTVNIHNTRMSFVNDITRIIVDLSFQYPFNTNVRSSFRFPTHLIVLHNYTQQVGRSKLIWPILVLNSHFVDSLSVALLMFTLQSMVTRFAYFLFLIGCDEIAIVFVYEKEKQPSTSFYGI